MIATFIALYACGFTLNYMTLMALSLCIGLLIDDAIVVRENIVRHIHMGKDHYTAAREGTDEIGLAVLATTLSIVAVFVPIAFMGGIVGKFFYPFGITVAAAVLVSLFVSFTLDPMLSAVWRDPPEGARSLRSIGRMLRAFEPRASEWCTSIYDALLRLALAHRKTTLAIAVATFAASIPIAGLVGTEMMPEADESFTSCGSRCRWAPASTTPTSACGGSKMRCASSRKSRSSTPARRHRPGQEHGPNQPQAGAAQATRPRRRSRSSRRSASAWTRIPGIELQVGWGRPIYVALLGNDDADDAAASSRTSGARFSEIRGITDIEVSVKEGTPALSVRLKPELAAEYGITHAQLGTTLRALIGGENSGYWLAPDGQNYEVITQLPRANRTIVDDIANLNIATGRQLADGTAEMIPLRSIATLERTFNPENIRRQDLQRRVALFANVQGRPAGDAGKEVQELVKTYDTCRRDCASTSAARSATSRRSTRRSSARCAGGDLHLHGAGLAVRQLPAAASRSWRRCRCRSSASCWRCW